MSEIILRAENLAKIYKTASDELVVLKDLSFSTRRGEFTAIQGASGVGKSTLLHLLGGLDRPDQGTLEIHLEGSEQPVQINQMNHSALNRFRNEQVGFVFQYHHLLAEFTALENVFLPALIQGQAMEEIQNRAKGLLSDFGLGGRLHHKPGQLSGGEAQRVAIARAMINQPALLLMDEPTGNLDRARSESIFELILSIHQKHNQTILVVTHDEEISALGQRTLHLIDGKIQEKT